MNIGGSDADTRVTEAFHFDEVRLVVCSMHLNVA
jgi:hypothetical protein